MKNSENIKALIIDDELKSREIIFNILTHHFPFFTIKTAENVAKGIENILDFNPDIVFLDVDMPDGTGFDVLRNINTYDFKVIFITGHEEYALKAIKFSATDYILKPVNALELVNAVNQTIYLIKEKNEQIKIETLLNNLAQTDQNKEKLILNTSDNIYIVELQNIIRCESDNNYTIFYTSDQDKITMSKTLKEYENILPDSNFIRIHRSHIININYISKISKKDSGYVLLKDNSKIPISSKKKDALLNLIKSVK